MIKQKITPKQAVETLSRAFKEDPDYAHSWHCNIAMSFYDSTGLLDHERAIHIANEGAARFMKLAFDVDTKQDV